MTTMRRFIYILLLLPLHLFATDFVTIGNPGNNAASNGKGTVAYNFQISKFEITNSEYCAFLNCVATEHDSYELFSPLMQEHFFGGIIRTGEDGHYVYSVKSKYENTPAIGVTWMSAIRYCNWLHYNSANIAQGKSLSEYSKQTEGDEKHGAYDTRVVPKARNKGAKYWLPNENEWLKAAYFNGKEWNESLLSEGSNCYTSKGWAMPYPHVKEVGKGVKPSHYGTFDQQGNAAEWIENSRSEDGQWKIALGGSLIRPSSFAAFNDSEGDYPEKSITTFGLRICRLADANILAKESESFQPRKAAEVNMRNPNDILGNEYVRVGDEGNRGDKENKFFGRVNYKYLIAKTELSNESYCRFLNAVAREADPYGLYDMNMATGACSGILRTKTSEGFKYSCKEGWDNRPVVYVNYYDICRFANWMHYGCPHTGKCELGTTEGTASQGAYNTTDFEEVRAGKKAPYKEFGERNVGAKFWIPSENEWYKAAYYDPEMVGNRKYHDYPTRTSDAPTQEQANYMVDNHFAVGEPFYVAPVDSFENAPSYYGTLQQGGNVWEWIEDWQYGIVGSRGLRGGSWSYTFYGLNAINTDPGSIDNSGYVFGARLCMAVDKDGWHPVKTPITEEIYEFVMLMPERHLLFAICLIATIIFVGIIATLLNAIKICSKQNTTS